MTGIRNYRDFKFGAEQELNSYQMDQLIQSFLAPAKKADRVLSGRMQARELELDGIGRVVIKPYFRGGILRYVNKRTYIRLFGKPRSRAEFEMLKHVRELGIYAPEPVAYAVKGRFFYHAWLATAQIENAVSLSELGINDPEAAREVIPSVARQAGILLSAGIHHVDLHPGNVLVDSKGRVWFIDFDRAKTGLKNRSRLLRLYLKRWKRASDKYGLPEFVQNALDNTPHAGH